MWLCQVIEDRPKVKASRPVKTEEKEGGRTIWRNIIWLIILFAYSFIGGVIFSAIEGGHDESELLRKYEHDMSIYVKHKMYQLQIFTKLCEIDRNTSYTRNESASEVEEQKMQLVSNALGWYEQMLGISITEPVMEVSRWNIWGGVYYAASLYTTIGK
ncbi:unnamed protein product [Gongylonema pulchrum]|uniref:Ion_trans_2 domain-containing protein n=1 Tax=Gongylonema pulchrum TaxID=637853 RepID=A0A183E2I9_9BILA|nr:unnamed protein product [Gongylonema pulchrum]